MDAIRRLTYAGVPFDIAIDTVIRYRKAQKDDELEALIQKAEMYVKEGKKCTE